MENSTIWSVALDELDEQKSLFTDAAARPRPPGRPRPLPAPCPPPPPARPPHPPPASRPAPAPPGVWLGRAVVEVPLALRCGGGALYH